MNRIYIIFLITSLIAINSHAKELIKLGLQYVTDDGALRRELIFLDDTLCTISSHYYDPVIAASFPDMTISYRYSKDTIAYQTIEKVHLAMQYIHLQPLVNFDSLAIPFLPLPEDDYNRLYYYRQISPWDPHILPNGEKNRCFFYVPPRNIDVFPKALKAAYILNPTASINLSVLSLEDKNDLVIDLGLLPSNQRLTLSPQRTRSVTNHYACRPILFGKSFTYEDSVCKHIIRFGKSKQCTYLQVFPGKDENIVISTACTYTTKGGLVTITNCNDTLQQGWRELSEQEKLQLSDEMVMGCGEQFERQEVTWYVNNIRADKMIYQNGYLYYSKIFSSSNHPTLHKYYGLVLKGKTKPSFDHNFPQNCPTNY